MRISDWSSDVCSSDLLIHQEINLAEDLTIAQNIFLGREIRHAGFLDNRAMSREAAHWLAQVGLHIDPNVRVRQLIVAEKQLVEIAKALAKNARLLDRKSAVWGKSV